MNKLIIIGNLTKDPELRTTPAGKNVANFTVAVNRRGQQREGQPDADFFRVAAWGNLGINCSKYLTKGSKVSVTGSVSIKTYTTQQGENRADMEISMADDVEFLSSRSDNQ